MALRVIPVDPFDLVIFGATGDLARRKILPGLYRRFLAGQMTPESRIIGAARAELTDAAFAPVSYTHLDVYKRQALFDGRQIKNIVQHHPQTARRRHDQLQPLAPLGCDGGGKLGMAKAQNGVERGTQLMAHLRQKARLCAVGGLCSGCLLYTSRCV